jgi:hypothetical protein
MSLYRELLGESQHADTILDILGLKREDIFRYRDAYLRDGKIRILARTQRDRDRVRKMILHPAFAAMLPAPPILDDTYVEFTFRTPENATDAIAAIATKAEMDPGKRFDAINKALTKSDITNPDYLRALPFSMKLVEQIREASAKGLDVSVLDDDMPWEGRGTVIRV